ncbi:MAG: hypothetical protein ACLQQ4_08795, partial [Bacteroidia bacterium]
KYDYRMIRNFLKGSAGDAKNIMLSAAVMNFKRMMNLWKAGKISLAQLFSLAIQQLFQPLRLRNQMEELKLTF